MLLGGLWLARPDDVRLRDGLRLLPDVLRLLARLARDRALPRTTRALLWLALAYLALPLDLVPDVVPVLGQADDVVVVVLVLRRVARRHPAALERHWPGVPAGLEAVRRLVAQSTSRLRSR